MNGLTLQRYRQNRRPSLRVALATILAALFVGTTLLVAPGGAVTVTDTIAINGNADMDSQAATHGWPGSGTANDPYIIEGLTITTSGDDGISIQNTDRHLIVRDNVITGGGGVTYGIYASGVRNAAFTNNTIRDHVLCVYLNLAHGNVFQDNDVSGCEYGYALISSNDNRFEDNVATEVRFGLYLLHAHRNDIFGNTIINATTRTAYIHNGDRNHLKDNTLEGGIEDGLWIRATSENRIQGNHIHDTPIGIRFTPIFDVTDPSKPTPITDVGNRIDNNTIESVSIGIFLDDVPGAFLADNTIRDADQGILVDFAHRAVLHRNHFVNDTIGIDLFLANNIEIVGGTYTDVATGIFGTQPRRSLISDVTVQGANVGIHLRSARDNEIRDVHLSDNTQGIRLDTGRTHIIDGGTFTGNGHAITFNRGFTNELRHAVLAGNDVGLRLISSDNNVIWDNRFNNFANTEVTGDGPNAWNVAERAGTNIVGGPRLGGNHWNDYTGFDLDGDGFGETPHSPLRYGVVGSAQIAAVTGLPYGPEDELPLVADWIVDELV